MEQHHHSTEDSQKHNHEDIPKSHIHHSSQEDSVSMQNHIKHSAMSGHSLAFHGGCSEIILFEGWKIDSKGGLIGSMIGVFLMAAMYEGLKYYRDYLFWRTHSDIQYQAVSIPADKSDEGQMGRSSRFSWAHTIQTGVYVVQMIISYFLMLIFMTYNVWLCFATIAGYAVGYFIFSWKKSIIVDVMEPCH